MSKAWAGGSTRGWRATRAAILARDSNMCRLRLPGPWLTKRGWRRCQGMATQVHHLHGKGRCPGCAADLADHLIAACGPCNRRAGDPGKTKAPAVKSISLRRTPYEQGKRP